MAAAGGTVPVGDVEEDASQLLFPKGPYAPARLSDASYCETVCLGAELVRSSCFSSSAHVAL